MNSRNVPTSSMYTSFRQLLVKQARSHDNEAAICWVGVDSRIEKRLSFADLERLSHNTARYLRNHGIEGGTRVAMIFEHSLDFFVAFLACQILLAVPIVLPSPAAETITSDILSLIPIVEDATPDVILTHNPVCDLLSKISGSPNEKAGALVQTFLQYAHQGLLNVDVFDEASGGIADPDEVWEDEEEVGAERLSLIQYTTGISGIPKGVMISHTDLVHQLALLDSLMPHHLRNHATRNSASRVKLCSMQPHWFGYSLIACYLLSLYQGYTNYMISCSTFSERPLAWIETLSKHQIHISFAPNRAFSAVMDAWKRSRSHPAQLSTSAPPSDRLDLSHCSQLISIGELVEPHIVEDFYTAFKFSGLKRGSFRIAYTVTENVLVVTISDGQLEVKRDVVAVGRQIPGTDIKIVDPETLKDLPSGREGEIWISGEYRARGYWRKTQKEVEQIFNARIPADQKYYLRTGDIGLIEHGQLFVRGRLNETMNIDGTNYYLPNIEKSLGSFQGVVKPLLLSIPPIKSTESTVLVVMVEIQKMLRKLGSTADKRDFCSRLARRMTVMYHLRPQSVILFDQDSIPRTHTGNLARVTAGRQFLINELVGSIHRWDRPNDAQPAASKPNTTLSRVKSLDWIKQRAWDAEMKRLLWQKVCFASDFDAFLPEKRISVGDTTLRPNNVFLTGSTGTIGPFILAELLRSQSQLTVFCLVRAGSATQGLQRVTSKMMELGLWKPWWTGRVIPVPGDLKDEKLGLSPQEFQSLAESVSTVIHCGSNSDFTGAYPSHDVINVMGTKETIRLALSNSGSRPSTYHYISTVTVFDTQYYSNSGNYLELEVDQPPVHTPFPGYAQTKWIGEQLVKMAARDYYLPSTIYRLGLPIGHSETGAGLIPQGLLMSLLGYCGHLKSIPDCLLEAKLPLVNVDHAARSIVSCSLSPSLTDQVSYYHVINCPKYPVKRLMEFYANITGPWSSSNGSDQRWNSADTNHFSNITNSPPDASKSISFLCPKDLDDRYWLVRWLSGEFSTVQLQNRARELVHTNITKSRGGLMATFDSERADLAVLASLQWSVDRRTHQYAKRSVPSSRAEPASSSHETALEHRDHSRHLWMLHTTPILAVLLSILWKISD